MTDFIVLRCPSCGGDIQVEQSMDMCYCLHCGTKLMLKKTEVDGQLAQLAAVQAAMLSSDLLKEQINGLEAKAHSIRKAFFEFYSSYIFYNKLPRLSKVLEEYQVNLGLEPGHFREAFASCGYFDSSEYRFDIARLTDKEIRGFTTPEEFFALYQYIIQPAYNDDETHQLVSIIQPIAQIHAELQAKKAELEKAIRTLGHPEKS
jgi:DNA-directed RNA polymerase subunit RPC12/RpoP